MSIPDILLDVGVTMTTNQDCKSHTSTDSGLPSTLSQGSEKSKLSPSTNSSRSTSSHSQTSSSHSRCSMISVDSCDSDCLSSLDEGEASWDALGRMNSIRRSNRFDKAQLVTVTLRKGSDGFGLELGGRSPPVIANVFGDAKTSGVRVGDKLLEVNGVSVRGLEHREAGKMIAEGPPVATLLIHTIKPAPTPNGQLVYSGWLLKKGGSGVTPRNWRRRWFVVKDDCIAYYYRSPSDTSPLGAIVLRNYTISKACNDCRKPFSFKVVKGGGRSYYFCAESEAEMSRWAQVFTEAATLEGRESVYFSGAAHNVSLSALAIKDPDCHGFLHKQGQSIRTWKRRYCVLKAHQLFYYGKMSHTTAYGVMNLTGYELCQGKTKDKKFYFQAVPPRRDLRVYHFYAETEGDRQRWMEAIKKSLTRAKGPPL